jgi:hypothetical protein
VYCFLRSQGDVNCNLNLLGLIVISHQYRAIFVHIPKSAGTSVGTKISVYEDDGQWGMQDHRAIRHLIPLRNLELKNYLRFVNYEIVYRHVRDRVLLNRQYPSKTQLDSYFKFTFVRNSWARVFSWYKNVMDDSKHMKRYRIAEGASFDWFVKNRLHTLKDQLYYITDANGNIGVDFIGRYENLADDFSQVCTKLNILDPQLPRKNSEGAPLYINHYDDHLIEIVARRYKRDIEYFKFEFGQF